MVQMSHLHFWFTDCVKGFGHVALQTDNSYISFWPCDDLKSVFRAIGGCPGKWFDSFEEEIDAKGYPNKTLHVSDLDTSKIEKWWKQFKSAKPHWNLSSQSCSSVVYQALSEGSDEFKNRVDGPITPSLVVKLVDSHIEKKKVKIWFGACKPCRDKT
ncbi:hypothetical protein ACF0H5_015558 [Mactra antiquata]